MKILLLLPVTGKGEQNIKISENIVRLGARVHIHVQAHVFQGSDVDFGWSDSSRSQSRDPPFDCCIYGPCTHCLH